MRSELFKLCEENKNLRTALNESRERYRQLQVQVVAATKMNPDPNPNNLIMTNPDLFTRAGPDNIHANSAGGTIFAQVKYDLLCSLMTAPNCNG